MLKTLTTLFLAFLFLSAAWADIETPASDYKRGVYRMDKSRDKTPAGASWPICWKFDFSIPNKIKVNKPFTVEVKVTPLLFALDKVEIVPVVGSELKLIKADPWKGSLKAGETKVMKLTMIAPKQGDNGDFGVIVFSTDFYNNFKKYISASYEGPAKEDLLERLAATKRENPSYQQYGGSRIIVSSK